MPDNVTIDNKSFKVTNAKAVTALFIAMSLTFSGTKFWAKAEATAKAQEDAKGAERRRIANQAEREAYERELLKKDIDIKFLELELREANEKLGK